MVSFWEDYFQESSPSSNCQIISKDGKVKNTHKLLLSALSDDLRFYMLSTGDWAEDACFILPDFTLKQIEDCLRSIFLKNSEEENDLFRVLSNSRVCNFTTAEYFPSKILGETLYTIISKYCKNGSLSGTFKVNSNV